MPRLIQGGQGAPAVLQVLQHLEPDEVGRSAVDMAGYLRAKGWRSVVASAGGRLERELAAAGATHLRLPLDRGGWLAVWRIGGRLARAIRRHRVDLVHARAPAAAWSGSIAARRTGASFVATFHDIHPLDGVLNRRCHGAMTGADRVIAVSDFMAGHLAREHGVDPTRVRVVHRWVDPDEFDPERVRGHRVQALAERWGIGAGSAKVVMMPGSVTRGRGHLLLLQALARLARADCTVLFVGGLDHRGAYVKELTAAVRKAALGERVRFGGDTEDLPAALALADVVVLAATRPDPSGIVAAAAQAMGKPVIVTDIGGLGETLQPGATGWLVPPNDPKQLASAMDQALSMPADERQRLAERARAWVLGRFTAERMCRQTLAVYRELLGPDA
jgi:glycosyltransferase involved in cell wall biosynthesis